MWYCCCRHSSDTVPHQWGPTIPSSNCPRLQRPYLPHCRWCCSDLRDHCEPDCCRNQWCECFLYQVFGCRWLERETYWIFSWCTGHCTACSWYSSLTLHLHAYIIKYSTLTHVLLFYDRAYPHAPSVFLSCVSSFQACGLLPMKTWWRRRMRHWQPWPRQEPSL